MMQRKNKELIVDFSDKIRCKIDKKLIAAHDYEIPMLKAQLNKTCDQLEEIKEMFNAMPQDTDVEAWLQSKITKISDYTNSVHGYMKYYEKDEDSNMYETDDPERP